MGKRVIEVAERVAMLTLELSKIEQAEDEHGFNLVGVMPSWRPAEVQTDGKTLSAISDPDTWDWSPHNETVKATVDLYGVSWLALFDEDELEGYDCPEEVREQVFG